MSRSPAVRDEALGLVGVGDVGLHGGRTGLTRDLLGLVLAGAIAERDARAGARELERDRRGRSRASRP